MAYLEYNVNEGKTTITEDGKSKQIDKGLTEAELLKIAEEARRQGFDVSTSKNRFGLVNKVSINRKTVQVVGNQSHLPPQPNFSQEKAIVLAKAKKNKKTKTTQKNLPFNAQRFAKETLKSGKETLPLAAAVTTPSFLSQVATGSRFAAGTSAASTIVGAGSALYVGKELGELVFSKPAEQIGDIAFKTVVKPSIEATSQIFGKQKTKKVLRQLSENSLSKSLIAREKRIKKRREETELFFKKDPSRALGQVFGQVATFGLLAGATHLSRSGGQLDLIGKPAEVVRESIEPKKVKNRLKASEKIRQTKFVEGRGNTESLLVKSEKRGNVEVFVTEPSAGLELVKPSLREVSLEAKKASKDLFEKHFIPKRKLFSGQTTLNNEVVGSFQDSLLVEKTKTRIKNIESLGETDRLLISPQKRFIRQLPKQDLGLVVNVGSAKLTAKDKVKVRTKQKTGQLQKLDGLTRTASRQKFKTPQKAVQKNTQTQKQKTPQKTKQKQTSGLVTTTPTKEVEQEPTSDIGIIAPKKVPSRSNDLFFSQNKKQKTEDILYTKPKKRRKQKTRYAPSLTALLTGTSSNRKPPKTSSILDIRPKRKNKKRKKHKRLKDTLNLV